MTEQLAFAQKNVLPLTPCQPDKALAALTFCKGNQSTAEKKKRKLNQREKIVKHHAEFKVRILTKSYRDAKHLRF